MKVRVIKALNKRIGKPSVNAPCKKICKRGAIFEVEETPVTGDSYQGNNQWYKDKSGNYYWSGGLTIVKREKSEPELKNNIEDSVYNPSLFPDKKNVTPVVPSSKGKETVSSDESYIEKPASSVNQAKLSQYIKDYQIDDLWKITRGKGIRVAILDSGLNYNGVEFKNRITTSYFNACSNSEMRADCQDILGHGTDCAAILCGSSPEFSGVAPEITLDVIKITDQSGAIDTAALARGLEKAIENKPNVIAMCFVMPIDNNFKKIQRLIKHAYDHNIVMVGAAGDQGEYKFPVNNYPASFTECISTGCLNANRKRSLFSSRSDFLNLMAPGEDIVIASATTIKTDCTGYSAAFVAGTVALLLAITKFRGKKISVNELYRLLCKNADKDFPDYNPLEYGWGIIDPLACSNAISL